MHTNICKARIPDTQPANLRQRHPRDGSKSIRCAVNCAVMHDDKVAIRGGAYITLNQVNPKAQRITGSGYRVFRCAFRTSTMTGNQKPLRCLHHGIIIARHVQPYFGSFNLMYGDFLSPDLPLSLPDLPSLSPLPPIAPASGRSTVGGKALNCLQSS